MMMGCWLCFARRCSDSDDEPASDGCGWAVDAVKANYNLSLSDVGAWNTTSISLFFIFHIWSRAINIRVNECFR